MLLDVGEDVVTPNKNNATPLDLAVSNSNTEAIRSLLSKEANVDTATAEAGATPLPWSLLWTEARRRRRGC